MRFLALSLPRLAVQVLRAGRPDLADRPLGLLAGDGDGALLTTVSVEATADGVEPGMTALQARQRCPAIVLEPDNAAACLDELERLASILRTRTTTDVAIVSRNAIALVLDGFASRFTDETAAAQGVLALARSWTGLDVRAAVASDLREALCAAARARRHPAMLPANPAPAALLPAWSPLSATYRAEQPLPREIAAARLAKMIGSFRPLLEAQPQSFRAVRMELARGPARTSFVIRPAQPVHTATEIASLVQASVTDDLEGVTELRVTLERPGPAVSVEPWRQHMATVHELSAPAVPVQRRLLRAS